MSFDRSSRGPLATRAMIATPLVSGGQRSHALAAQRSERRGVRLR